MKKEIYIIRHGETENNRLKIWGGSSGPCNINLNEAGRAQALAAARGLEGIGLEALFHSPLLRTTETGEIIARYLEIPYSVCEGIQEVYYGVVEGMFFDDIAQQMPDTLDEYLNHMRRENFSFSFPNGETLEVVFKRAIKALEKVVEQPYQKIAVVSHAGLMRILRCGLGKTEQNIPNCGYIKITYDGVFHLEDGSVTPPPES